MFEFDKANGVIERGELLYSVPHDSEIVLDTGVPAYSGPALLKFKYPVKHAPSALIVTQTVAEKLNEKRASIVVEIIRCWKDIPKADLASIILGAGAYSGGFSLSPIEKIEGSIDLDSLELSNKLIAYMPLPADKAPENYPITFTVSC